MDLICVGYNTKDKNIQTILFIKSRKDFLPRGSILPRQPSMSSEKRGKRKAAAIKP
jgi:hypothetical protein